MTEADDAWGGSQLFVVDKKGKAVHDFPGTKLILALMQAPADRGRKQRVLVNLPLSSRS